MSNQTTLREPDYLLIEIKYDLKERDWLVYVNNIYVGFIETTEGERANIPKNDINIRGLV